MNSSMQSKSAAPALDLDELMEKIRAEVAERKQLHGATAPPEPAQTPAADFATRNWNARELLALPATDFARAVHVAFFGREPSPDEFVRLRDRLLVEHTGRTRILREFCRSPEARTRRLPVEGLRRQLIWDRVYWSPPAKFGRAVGRGARNIWLLPRHFREFAARMAMVERRTAEMTAALRNLQSAQVAYRNNTNQHLRRLQETIEGNNAETGRRVEQTERWLDDTKSRLADVEARLVEHWRSIVEHKRGLEGIAAAIRSDSVSLGGDGVAQAVAREQSRLLDPLYVSFEDRYRGTRAEIKERQRIYLSRLKAATADADQAPVVDIGCGRGEWLELLREGGIAARGFDLNRVAVEESRARGLNVELADGLEALAALAPQSCSAVTGFHIIEHLPFESVVKLLDEALRVLRAGGVLILETPNPANLLVAAERFYLDPTHRNPLPSELTAYLMQSRGFDDIEILPLHPLQVERREYADPMLALVQEKLYGPQDYGAIGRKSA